MTTVNDAILDLQALVAGVESVIDELRELNGDGAFSKIDSDLRDEVIFHLGYDL